MKALLQSGLVLALGVVAAGAVAEEVKWRRVNDKNATTTPSGAASVPLGRPVPLVDSAPNDVQPISFRAAASVFRDNNDSARPLPNGPILSPETLRVIVDDPTKDEKKDKKDDKKGEKAETLDFPPKPIPGPEGVQPYISGSSPCCGETIICNDCCCFDSCCADGRCPGLFRWIGGIGFWGNPRGDYCTGRGRLWLSAEYLNWQTRDQSVPPLLTTSPPGTAQIDAGVLGRPGTTILFDEGTLENDERSGGRFTLGFWLPCYCDVGLEVGYFFLGRKGQSFTAASNGTPILARPLVDANTGAELSQLVAFPNVVAGSFTVDYNTRMWGLDAGFRHKLCCGPCGFIDIIYGYRHLQLEDDLNISERLSAFQTGAAPLGILIRDSFATRNVFNGGQIGIECERRLWRRWFLGGYAKAAFGVNHQIVNINGTTTFSATAPGIAGTQPAGILALPTNIGHHSRDRFSVVPELGFKFGWDMNEHLRIWFGYSALWLTDAVRAGEQIDRVINRSQIPNNVTGIGPLVGQPRPLVTFRTQDFWAQGFNFGLEYRY